MHLPRALAAVLAAAASVGLAAAVVPPAPAAPGAAAPRLTYAVRYVPTVGDAVIRVEILRDRGYDAQGQPVLLTYSPYNSLGEPEPARDSLAERYVPRGYARAVADVLGTRGSTGCWDYGGANEQQSGVDLVRWLAQRRWSSGRVAMIGGSYNGTTASMVAARGGDVPALRAVVPISAISRWYGYAYGNGVRYFLNSEVPSDEGFDTPLAFDLGFGRTVAADPMGQHFADTLRSRAAECDTSAHTQEGYSRHPDYDRFWLRRDYRKDARDFRAAVLLAHGWQDYNVKQQEATALFRRLRVDRPGTARVEGVPFKLMYLTQGTHSGGTDGRGWQPLLDRFLAHTLKGVGNGVESVGPVITQGRDSQGPTRFRTAAGYPLPRTDETTLWLRDGGTLGRRADRSDGTHVASYTESGTSTEEARTATGSGPPGGSLYYASRPLSAATRMVGPAALDAWVRPSSETMHLTPVLLDVAPNGSTQTIARGFLNLDYRKGLRTSDPAPGEWQRARVTMLPQDYTVRARHRVALLVQSSNTVWAVPGSPGTVDVATGHVAAVTPVGSRLVLPTLR
ncbi:MAG: CocE/NonD family hydrolase [Actinomycetota bacterium]|nr:CocE/NonD family hydrolase [Actinomycetota bacterium]